MNVTEAEVSRGDIQRWAQAEFGHVELGHQARTKRVVAMAARMCEEPNGQITRIFENPAELQGAYRALESETWSAEALNDAALIAAVRRASSYDGVYIPIDGTSLTLKSSPAKDLSEIGVKSSRSKGVHIQNSLVIAETGQVLGVGRQVYYQRKRRRKRATRKQRRKMSLEQKESRHWLTCMKETEEAFEKEGVSTHRTYLCDRGSDFREMLEHMAQVDYRVIVRSSWNRGVLVGGPDEEEKSYLVEEINQAPIMGRYVLEVSAGPKRSARTAIMEVRARGYVFRLNDRKRKRVTNAYFWVVQTREVSSLPQGERPIEWRLISNQPITDFEGAAEVVYAYTQRWRIEEMHRCWKSVCQVETTRLRNFNTIIKFAALMASVATRIEHLKSMSRAEPDAPASKVFSPIEIQAIKLLHFRKGAVPDAEPTVLEAVEWVAQLGGYLGRRNGPPGQQTIGRGLLRLQQTVETLELIGWVEDS
jgi:hypothetical protein